MYLKSGLLIIFISILFLSCSERESLAPSGKTLPDIWYRQLSPDLGARISMQSTASGLAVSRGKGEEKQGKVYRYNGEIWTEISSYSYSDFPIVQHYDSNTIWNIHHESHHNNYKPRLFKIQGDLEEEIPLPEIMWDNTDYVMWKDLSILPDGTAWMVGQQGYILYYDGKIWRQFQSPMREEKFNNLADGDLNSVYMLNEKDGWAVGWKGTILHFDGRIWKKVASPVDVNLNKVVFDKNGDGWAVGSRGVIIRYMKGRWENFQSDTRSILYSVSVFENKVYIVGSRSTFLTISDDRIQSVPGIGFANDDFYDISIVKGSDGKEKIWLIGADGIYSNSQSLGFSFTDVTSQSNLRTQSFAGSFFDKNNDNYPDILTRVEESPGQLSLNLEGKYFGEVTPAGENFIIESQTIAIGDVNNDGYADLLQVLNDTYFRFLLGSSGDDFIDFTGQSFIQFPHIDDQANISAKFIDLDADGNLDLYLSNNNLPDAIFKGNGCGQFFIPPKENLPDKFLYHDSYGATFSDLDQDGLPDIIIPYKFAENGKYFQIFRNLGDFKFEQADLPLSESEATLLTYSVCSGDINQDGLPDIFVINNREPNKLFLNEGQFNFSDRTAEFGFNFILSHNDPSNGIANFADVNNDNFPDLFLGSRLFMNVNGKYFNDVTNQSGIDFSGNPVFEDYDQDGDQDIYIAATRNSFGEGKRAALFRNNLINRSYVGFRLFGDISNRDAAGSVIRIFSDSSGVKKLLAFREYGLGENPMTQNSSKTVYFGYPPAGNIYAEVKFPSGIIVKTGSLEKNTVYDIHESSFISRIMQVIRKDILRTYTLYDPKSQIPFAAIFLIVLIAIVFRLRAGPSAFLVLNPYFMPLNILIYHFILHLLILKPIMVQGFAAISLPLVLSFIYLKAGSLIDEKKKSVYISHYRILELIGTGGMGKVYKVKNTLNNNIAALKVINQDIVKDEENKKRLKAEADLLSGLEHQNIVKLFELGEETGRAYFAMEFLPNGTLADYIETNYPIPLTEVKEILFQICDALDFIHKKGIVHRDLKSSNLMFDSAMNIKLMDFGLSKSFYVSKMTTIGTVIGTLGFVSPEQITNSEIDNRSDIFSFGVIIYQMLTNRLPFTGDNEIALIHSIFNDEPIPPSEIVENLSPVWDRIIAKCLMKEKNNRYSYIYEVKKDLDSIK